MCVLVTSVTFYSQMKCKEEKKKKKLLPFFEEVVETYYIISFTVKYYFHSKKRSIKANITKHITHRIVLMPLEREKLFSRLILKCHC